jgi:hypothetical protein
MLTSFVSASKQYSSVKWLQANQVKDMKVDGELEPEIKEAFLRSAGEQVEPTLLLEPKNLKALTSPETFQAVKEASQNGLGLIELDLGSGSRSYFSQADTEGCIRLCDYHYDDIGNPQVITIGKEGKRVGLSTWVDEGEDRIAQHICMALDKRGAFNVSSESIGVNSDAMMKRHRSALAPLAAKDFNPSHV